MGLSVSGIVSGLDVPTIVSQLMQSESIPQQNLQMQLSTVQTQASTYRAINSKFSALLSAAQAMTSSATWTATTASSSASSVGVAAASTAQAGSVSFTVDQTATAQSMITNLATPWKSTSDAYGLSVPLTVTDTTTSTVLGTVNPTGTGTGGAVTLGDMVSAINGNSALGLSAAAVQVSPGNYQLQLTATSTGKAHAFSLSDASFGTVTTAQDAQLSVGSTSPYTVTSSTNTFTGFMPGVTMTVSQKEPNPVTVAVVSDPQSVGDKMKALVDAANAALSEISTDTDTGMGSSNSSGKAGPLAGDYGMQSLAQQVRTIVSSAVGTLGSPVQAALQLNSDGTIKFDESAFVGALKTNPNLVNQLIDTGAPATTTTDPTTGVTTTVPAVPGIAAQLVTLATAATDSVTGTLVTLANGEDSQAKTLQSQIDDWTVRLTAQQQALTTQYSNLQTMLNSLQNQQSWLSSMFNMTSTSSSSSSSSSKSS